MKSNPPKRFEAGKFNVNQIIPKSILEYEREISKHACFLQSSKAKGSGNKYSPPKST
jgi:hypothetical protein